MIRELIPEDLIDCTGGEAAIRIAGLAAAYGTQAPFIRYYADADGKNRLAVMDGTAIFHAPDGVNEEWRRFLCLLPDIERVRTDAVAGETLSALWKTPARRGILMRYAGEQPIDTATEGLPAPDKLYALLCRCFAEMPPFESWYVDVSHRVRHGVCHIATLWRGETCISNAISVAETNTQALLGAVCTDAAYRGQGGAARCIRALIRQLSGRQIFLSPKTDDVIPFYEKLGFVPCGTWAVVGIGG